MLSRLIDAPRRGAMGVLDWVNDNPLSTAGVTMAAIAGLYLGVVIQGQLSAGPQSSPASLIWSVLSNRPAYPLAIVIGIGSVVYRR